MRVLIGCFMLVLVLVCTSCRGHHTDGQGASKAAQVHKLLKEECRGHPFSFEVRGPVAVMEFREVWVKGYDEWAGRMRKHNRSPGTFEDSSQGREYARLAGQYREGDELYFFRSEARSWSDLSGTEGYVLIREDRIVDTVITGEN
jgi:hypothetical protein